MTHRPIMPMQVRIALALIGVEVLYGLYGLVQAWSAMSAMSSTMPASALYAVLGTGVGMLALHALIMAGVVWRKNWARIGWLVITLIGLAGMLLNALFLPQFVPNMPQPPASQVMLSNVTQVVSIVATYLLFSAGGRVWFRRDEPEHV
jgi:hypothetical protein